MIPFSPPHIDRKTVDEVAAALLSGWITTGPRTKRFEKKLTEYAGHKSTLCVSSGSGGLELVLRWFGVGPGDEVIVPAYTYAATANVVVHCGAKPVMVDVGEDFNIDPGLLEEAITERTKAIIPVDIAGWPCDYDRINALVTKNEVQEKFNAGNDIQQQLGRILVLADAAHSIGASYKGKHSGNLTDISVYSFHAVKNLTTAEGGAVCLNLPEPFDVDEVYNDMNIKSLHGQTKDALAKTQKGSWQYDIIEPGYKFNMTDIQAAMGLVELERYDSILERRKEIFRHYSGSLGKFDWAQLPVSSQNDRQSSFHVFLLRIKGVGEEGRNRIIQRIFDKEVSVNVHYLPLPLLTYYKNAGYRMRDFPVSFDSYSREISLPVYYDLTDEQARLVIKAVIEAMEEEKS